MLTISKPISASQAKEYHKEEFANAQDNYYSEGERVKGEWHGQLAAEWGLHGEVNEGHFARLADGQHPISGAQLVEHRAALEYENERGDKVKTMEHRAGWDGTFSAPKTISLTALVGRDERVTAAHRESVNIALDELEKYVQARVSSHEAETTGKWVAAKFEHDSSRPVDGYAAPQLHTHVVFFNITERENEETRSLQPRELYRSQQYATAVYRSELALRLKELGYEVEQGASGQAFDYAREKNLERQAVAEERELLRDALKRSMGDASLEEVRADFEKRIERGELIEAAQAEHQPGRAFTTEQMQELERENIRLMRQGQNQREELATKETRREIEREHAHLLLARIRKRGFLIMRRLVV